MDFAGIFFLPFILVFVIVAISQAAIIFTIFKVVAEIFKSFKRKSTTNFFKSNVIHNSNTTTQREKYVDISKKELATFNTDDLDTFKNYFYKIFVDFENAYNNLDYNTMKSLSTKQLFHNYHTGITLDLEIGKKRIINNIQKKKVIIYEVFSSSVKQVVSAMIEISYINYTMNKDGVVISGSRDVKTTEKFEVIFRKDFETEDVTNCPNCGATVTGNKCDFCRTSLKNVSFKINSIKKIVND